MQQALRYNLNPRRGASDKMNVLRRHVAEHTECADGTYCVLELNPRFGGGFPFSYEAEVNMPKAIIQWVKGEPVDPSMLVTEYDRMFAKNDYLVEVKR